MKFLKFFLPVLCLVYTQVAAAVPSDAITVFRCGEEGHRVYRIPAIVRAANGHLLA